MAQMKVFENIFQTLRRTTDASFRSILPCDTALESSIFAFEDGNTFQACVHIRHSIGTRGTERILNKISSNLKFSVFSLCLVCANHVPNECT